MYFFALASPALVLLTLFLLAPAVLTFVIAFTDLDYRFNWNFVGFENFIRIIRDPLTVTILTNTAIFVSGTLAFNVGMGLFLALLSTSLRETTGTFLRAAWLLPRIMPSVVFAFSMTWFFSPLETGTLNQILTLLQAGQVAFTKDYPWPFLFLLNGFVGCSLGMVVFSSAIKSIPQDIINAARADGASGTAIAIKIIIPLIRWQIAFITAYQTLSLLTSFEYILLTLDGGPGYYTTEVWVLHAYHRAFSEYQLAALYGYASALISFLAGIGIVASLIYWRVFRLKELIAEPKIEVY